MQATETTIRTALAAADHHLRAARDELERARSGQPDGDGAEWGQGALELLVEDIEALEARIAQELAADWRAEREKADRQEADEAFRRAYREDHRDAIRGSAEYRRLLALLRDQMPMAEPGLLEDAAEARVAEMLVS